MRKDIICFHKGDVEVKTAQVKARVLLLKKLVIFKTLSSWQIIKELYNSIFFITFKHYYCIFIFRGM